MELKTKMTAVEWLEEQTRKSEWHSLKRQDIFQQAKEMEKQNIKEAHTHNRCINNQTYDCTIEAFYNAEQYYNETFGK